MYQNFSPMIFGQNTFEDIKILKQKLMHLPQVQSSLVWVGC